MEKPYKAITAQEAQVLAGRNKIRTRFLSNIYELIRRSADQEKTSCIYTLYDEAIGDVNALYGGEKDLVKILTPIGLDCVNELIGYGYKVEVSLYYEERQFVDMRLQFNISWAK